MTTIYAIVQGGMVVNSAVAAAPMDSTWVDPQGQFFAIGYSYSNGVFTPPAAPQPSPTTPATMAAAAIAAGLSVTSTSTPTLNATYACDQATMNKIVGEVVQILNSGTFIGGGSTLTWPDISGVPRTFPSTTQFKAWASAIGAYIQAVTQYADGITSTLPANSVTIA